jgi:hypothetical protein
MSLLNRVQNAVKLKPWLIVSEFELTKTDGYPISEFESVGLSKADLKKLVRHGIALLGYKSTKAGWVSKYCLIAKDGNNGRDIPST